MEVEQVVRGHSEEGRETLLVAISDEANLRKLDRYREINAKLAIIAPTSVVLTTSMRR